MYSSKRTFLAALSGCVILSSAVAVSFLLDNNNAQALNEQNPLSHNQAELKTKTSNVFNAEFNDQSNQDISLLSIKNTNKGTNTNKHREENNDVFIYASGSSDEIDLSELITNMPDYAKAEYQIQQDVKSVSKRVDALDENLSEAEYLELLKDIDALDQQDVFLPGEVIGLKAYIKRKSGLEYEPISHDSATNRAKISVTMKLPKQATSNRPSYKQTTQDLTEEMISQERPVAEIKQALNQLYRNQLAAGSGN